MTQKVTGGDLPTPDEIMPMPSDLQLQQVQGNPTALARRLHYHADSEFRGLFQPQGR